MEVGDYLYCKKEISKNIKCGDGVVGVFDPKIGEMYQIIDINDSHLSINFKGHSVWFTLEDVDDYFCEWFRKYFDELRVERKNKLIKLKKIFTKTQ